MDKELNEKMKKDFEELFKELEFTQEEKELISKGVEKIHDNEDYKLLKRKFYHELEGYDLEIALIKMKTRENPKSAEKLIKELEHQKEEFIKTCGFVFDYKK